MPLDATVVIKTGRRRDAAAVLIAAVLVLVGCTSRSGRDENSTSASAVPSAAWFSVYDSSDFGGFASTEVRRVPATRQSVFSPHVYFRVSSAGFVNSIDAVLASHISGGRLSHTNPPAGQQILVAALELGEKPVFATGGHPRAAVVLGTDRHDITTTIAYRPSGGYSGHTSVIVASLPKHVPAEIVVSDERRTTTFDLRTGKGTTSFPNPRTQTLHSIPEQVIARSVAGAALGSGTVYVTLTCGTLNVLRLAWAPRLGWARAGRVWWAVAGFQISDTAGLPVMTDVKGLGFRPAANTFRLAVGKQQVAPSNAITSSGLVPRFDGQAVYFDVPATLRAAALLIKINGRLSLSGRMHTRYCLPRRRVQEDLRVAPGREFLSK